MSIPVIVRPAAKDELAEAYDWYEKQRPGLGSDFVDRVEEALDRIGVMPTVHAMIFENIRHARVPKYPYAIYYQVESDQVVVIAVVHDKRDPKVWQSRV